MTTEEDFQAELDRNPDDWQTRLVFADWLQERDDPRAEGYRALGENRKYAYRPTHDARDQCPYFANQKGGYCCHEGVPGYHALPSDWFDAIEFRGKSTLDCPRWFSDTVDTTRAEVESAAALAFAKLPPERQAELLNPQPVEVAV